MLLETSLILAALAAALTAHRRARRRGGRALPALVAITLLCTVLVALAADQRRQVADTPTSRLIKHNLAVLRAHLADPSLRTLLIVDGGSYPTRGLNGERFGAVLSQRLGRRVGLVQMSQGSANHFERYDAFRRLLAELDAGERERLRRKDLHLLLEVQRGYDASPMAQFQKMAYSDRAYAYLGPGNAWAAMRSLSQVGAGRARANAGPRTRDLVAHALVNGFLLDAVGRRQRVENLPRDMPGYLPIRAARPDFAFPGLQGVRDRLDQDREPSMMAWVDSIRVPRLQALFGDLVDHTAFYAVPTTYPDYATYARAFCRKHAGSVCVHYADPRLLQRLDAAAMWADKGHLSQRGAFVYSTWLAGRLASALTVTAPEPNPRPE
jgi:hypothetical protein